MSAGICTCFSPSSIVSAAARSCASVSSAVAVSDACSSLVYIIVHESHVCSELIFPFFKCSIVTIVEWWLQLVPADACQVFLCVCGGACRSCRCCCRCCCCWCCRSCACCHGKLCRSLPNVLSGSRLCPTRFPLFSFLLCLLVCLCSCCRCCCLTCRQCNCFSSLVDVLFVCVCAVMELTSIVLPGSLLRYHVKFHCSTCLSISSIVTAQLCDHSYCIVLSLWAQVCKGSRPCDPGIVHGHYCMCIVHMVQ